MYKIEYKFIDYGGSTDKAQMHKIEHDAAYALLYKMLEGYHGITNPAFDRNENGKPFLVGYDVHFSISHTEGLVTCAISDKPIGVDAEKISGKRDFDSIFKFASRFFTDNEINHLCALGYPEEEFIKIWTAKESYIKRIGGNMSCVKKIDTLTLKFDFIKEKSYIICINV